MESVGAGYQNTGRTEEKQLSDAFRKGFNTKPGDPRPEIGAVEEYLMDNQIASLGSALNAQKMIPSIASGVALEWKHPVYQNAGLPTYGKIENIRNHSQLYYRGGKEAVPNQLRKKLLMNNRR